MPNLQFQDLPLEIKHEIWQYLFKSKELKWQKHNNYLLVNWEWWRENASRYYNSKDRIVRLLHYHDVEKFHPIHVEDGYIYKPEEDVLITGDLRIDWLTKVYTAHFKHLNLIRGSLPLILGTAFKAGVKFDGDSIKYVAAKDINLVNCLVENTRIHYLKLLFYDYNDINQLYNLKRRVDLMDLIIGIGNDMALTLANIDNMPELSGLTFHTHYTQPTQRIDISKLSNCQKLRRFFISYAPTSESIDWLLNNPIFSLERVGIENFSFDCIPQFLKNSTILPNLKVLTLIFANDNENIPKNFGIDCPASLEALFCNTSSNISDPAPVDMLEVEGLNDLGRNCPNIKYLYLGAWDFELMAESLDPSLFPNLERLERVGFKGTPTANLGFFKTQCKKFIKFGEKCKNLKEFEFFIEANAADFFAGTWDVMEEEDYPADFVMFPNLESMDNYSVKCCLTCEVNDNLKVYLRKHFPVCKFGQCRSCVDKAEFKTEYAASADDDEGSIHKDKWGDEQFDRGTGWLKALSLGPSDNFYQDDRTSDLVIPIGEESGVVSDTSVFSDELNDSDSSADTWVTVSGSEDGNNLESGSEDFQTSSDEERADGDDDSESGSDHSD